MNIAEAICYTTAILYILFDFIIIFSFLFFSKLTTKSLSSKPISVIIAAKNEAENLKKNLPKVLSQNVKHFEVIVVDDQSTDNTPKIIQDLRSVYPHLNYYQIDNMEQSSKKHALQKGIAMANHKHLIFTDADCKPLSDEWLGTIQGYFTASTSVVLGYSPYQKVEGNLNSLIRFETYQTALNYFGFAKLGLAYMGVGRNLGYTKSVFTKSNGFKTHKHLLSGDDDLLINQISEQIPIQCCIEPKSFVQSKPENTFKSWIQQKRRHYTTAPFYKLKHQFMLGFQFFVKFMFWCFVLPTSFILMFFGSHQPFIFIVTVLIIKQIISKPIFEKLRVKDLWLQSFKLEFQLVYLQLYIFSLNLVSPKQEW